MIRTELEQLISDLCRDDENVLTPEQQEDAFSLGLNRINQDSPALKVTDIVASDSITAALPVGFDESFSSLEQVEFPIGERPRCYLQGVSLYEEPTGKVLDFPYSVSGTLRVSFTIKHTINDTTNTLKEAQLEAFASYVAALLCEQLATHYSHDSDSSIQVDSINHADKADKFRRRARELHRRYSEQVKPKLPGNQSASQTVSFGTKRRRR